MDLVPLQVGAAILHNADYPLHLRCIGVVYKAPDNYFSISITYVLIESEKVLFSSHFIFKLQNVRVGTSTFTKGGQISIIVQ